VRITSGKGWKAVFEKGERPIVVWQEREGNVVGLVITEDGQRLEKVDRRGVFSALGKFVRYEDSSKPSTHGDVNLPEGPSQTVSQIIDLGEGPTRVPRG
jgi:hypothetical protein